MKSHEIDYKIYGDDLQFVEIELDPNETVIAEAGSMMYLEDGIKFEAKMGDGSEPQKGLLGKLFDAGKRFISQESVFLTHFTNTGTGKKKVAFGSPYPGKIIDIDLDTVNNELLCQKESFLCAALGTKIDIAFNKNIGVGIFGGEGFILEKLIGDGKVFIHAGGTIIRKKLDNEKLYVDTGCIVAFESSINYNIEKAGNLKSMIFGGEGLFLATLHGTGYIWLQSLPFSRLSKRVLENGRALFGKQTGESSPLGGLGKIFMGD